MKPNKVLELPTPRQLHDFAKAIHFPATAATIRRSARELAYPTAMARFLRAFPADEIFKSQTDFLTRSEELELLIREEQAAPNGRLQGPLTQPGD